MGLTLSSRLSLRLAGGSAWSPLALGASLLGWWDAERSDLITQSGGLVSSWKDVVARYDAVQTTGSQKPVYSASSFNARPGLTFDGVDDFLGLESVPFPTGGSKGEIWALASQSALPADTGTRIFASYGGTNTTGSRRLQRVVSGGVNRARFILGDGVGGAATGSNNAVDLSGAHVLRAIADASGANVEVDGTSGVPAAVIQNTGTTRTRIGSDTGATAGNFFSGVFAALIVTNVLTTTQSAQLLAYLKARGGIS